MTESFHDPDDPIEGHRFHAAADYAAVLRQIHSSAEELLKILAESDAHIVGALPKEEHQQGLLVIKNRAAVLATVVEAAIAEHAANLKPPPPPA